MKIHAFSQNENIDTYIHPYRDIPPRVCVFGFVVHCRNQAGVRRKAAADPPPPITVENENGFVRVATCLCCHRSLTLSECTLAVTFRWPKHVASHVTVVLGRPLLTNPSA